MGTRNIEDGFTLPERRTACREGDVPVSTKEYRRLRKLEKADPITQQVYADLDRIQQETAGECEHLNITKGKGPKAAKASALREYDRAPNFNERIRQIGLSIAARIIADFKETYNVADLLRGDFLSKNHPLVIWEIVTLPMGWNENEYAPEDASDDMRENFLYKLKEFVMEHVRARMQNLVKVIINGESIWDNWDIKVNLKKGSGGSPKTVDVVDVEVFFELREDPMADDSI